MIRGAVMLAAGPLLWDDAEAGIAPRGGKSPSCPNSGRAAPSTSCAPQPDGWCRTAPPGMVRAPLEFADHAEANRERRKNHRRHLQDQSDGYPRFQGSLATAG